MISFAIFSFLTYCPELYNLIFGNDWSQDSGFLFKIVCVCVCAHVHAHACIYMTVCAGRCVLTVYR